MMFYASIFDPNIILIPNQLPNYETSFLIPKVLDVSTVLVLSHSCLDLKQLKSENIERPLHISHSFFISKLSNIQISQRVIKIGKFDPILK